MQEYQINKPTYQKFLNLANELNIQTRVNKLQEDKVKKLESENHYLKVENERLNQLLAQQQSKEENGYYMGFQQDTADFDSTGCLIDDINDVKDNIGSFNQPQ